MTQWIVIFKDYGIPFILDSKSKVKDYFEKYNEAVCDGEAKISETYGDTFDFASENEITFNNIILTDDGFDENDPLAIAYEYTYEEDFLKFLNKDFEEEIEETSDPKIINCYNPLFQEQKYGKIFHAFRAVEREINGEESISLQIIKEVSHKNIKISSQKDIINWLYDNIDITSKSYQEDISEQSFINHIIQQMSNDICINTKRGLGNQIIVGENIYKNIENMIVKTNDNKLDIYSSPDYEFKGFIGNNILVYVPKDKSLIKDNAFLMSLSSPLSSGAFILKDKDGFYLNPIEHHSDMNTIYNYADFFKIVEID